MQVKEKDFRVSGPRRALRLRRAPIPLDIDGIDRHLVEAVDGLLGPVTRAIRGDGLVAEAILRCLGTDFRPLVGASAQRSVMLSAIGEPFHRQVTSQVSGTKGALCAASPVDFIRAFIQDRGLSIGKGSG